MRLFLVVDETRFFHPDFIADFLRTKNPQDEVVGVALITKISPKNNIAIWLARHWYYLRLKELIKLVTCAFVFAWKDKFTKSSQDGRFYSVRSALKSFGVFFFEVQNDINKEEYLSKIKSTAPDVVLSSCSLYFGKTLLSIPKTASINRHSALLPSYRGLLPVFQAYRSGEKMTGASIHMMEKTIDAGIVLAQKQVPILPTDSLYELYRKCFRASGEALKDALDVLRRGQARTKTSTPAKTEYFSFPTADHWKAFRLRGGRFI